jgi:outer membrane receptor protein involved in Fe transport
LKPERLWNYQATLQARPAAALTASATVYYADLSNLIVTTGRFPNLNLQNTGHALNRGWEGSVRWRPQKRVALQSGYAYLRSTNLAPYVPAHKWNYAVELDAGRVFVHVGGMTVGRRWADAGRTRELPGYTLATLRFTVPVKRHWNLFGMLDNLLDRRYEVVNGYPMPGVNATGGFSFSF